MTMGAHSRSSINISQMNEQIREPSDSWWEAFNDVSLVVWWHINCSLHLSRLFWGSEWVTPKYATMTYWLFGFLKIFILYWTIVDRLQSMGWLGVGQDWATSLWLFTFMLWRRKWQPTPLFLPGESQGRGSLVGCCLWGRTESDTIGVT